MLTTPCNYCKLESIKRHAKKAKETVTVLSDALWGMGGKNVYTHPPEINILVLAGGEDGERKKYRRAWMMSIPEGCAC